MNLYAKLREREAVSRPVRVGLIGAGKFGAMYLAQVPRTPGLHLVAIADISPAAALRNLERVGWNPSRCQAMSIDDSGNIRLAPAAHNWSATLMPNASASSSVLTCCTASALHTAEEPSSSPHAPRMTNAPLSDCQCENAAKGIEQLPPIARLTARSAATPSQVGM